MITKKTTKKSSNEGHRESEFLTIGLKAGPGVFGMMTLFKKFETLSIAFKLPKHVLPEYALPALVRQDLRSNNMVRKSTTV